MEIPQPSPEQKKSREGNLPPLVPVSVSPLPPWARYCSLLYGDGSRSGRPSPIKGCVPLSLLSCLQHHFSIIPSHYPFFRGSISPSPSANPLFGPMKPKTRDTSSQSGHKHTRTTRASRVSTVYIERGICPIKGGTSLPDESSVSFVFRLPGRPLWTLPFDIFGSTGESRLPSFFPNLPTVSLVTLPRVYLISHEKTGGVNPRDKEGRRRKAQRPPRPSAVSHRQPRVDRGRRRGCR